MIVRQYAPCNLGRNTICLGKQGEINALRVEFDVSAWMAMYPDATVKLMNFAPDRPQDNPVIPTLGVEGTTRVWIVGEDDTASAGNGVIELLLIDERTGSTIKSATGYTTVLHSPSAGIKAQEAEAGYVRYDIDQSALLTDEQKAMARKNIGAGTGDGTESGTGGITVEKDPTVPAWAKQPSKPTYTAGEVGARPDTWTPSAREVGADAAGTAAAQVVAHNVSGEAHADMRALIEGLTSRLNALADSDDETLDQLSEIVAYIKSNKALIDAVTTGKVSTSDIVDNLVTNVASKPLSAAQGVALKRLIDEIVIPDKLPNPQPLTINGQSYDGSAAVEVSVTGEGGGANINDTTPSSTTTYSSQKIEAVVSELNQANVKQDAEIEALKQASGIVTIEPAEGDIPKVFIDGTIPTTKDDVLAEMTYISKSKEFHAYLKIKCQGSSSMGYPKKNFTVKLYADEARETDMSMTMRDWGIASNKFVLKANYIDHSHARNVVSANLWSEIVASRSDYNSLPVELRNSPNNGAVDGFPIKVYTNGTYQGIYTWNIGKDAWLWGMDEANVNHVLLCNELNTDGTYAENASNFRALWNGVDGTNWSVEVGTNSTAVKNSLNALISCVKDTTDDEFKAQIGTYLDIQAAIDYYIFAYVDCGLDNLAKNMLLGTYDLVKWYPGQYDMDSTWGLYWNGSKFVAATYRCPEDYQEQFSLLWERIEALYYEEIKTRYAQLRAGVLSLPNIDTHFERFMDVIGLDLYAEDLTIYTGIPSGSTNNIKQIRDFVRDRLVYVDAEIAALDAPAEEIPCTGITLDQTTLTFTAAGTQTLTVTVTPSDTTDIVTWSSDAPSVASVSGGVVTAKANGSATITANCGSHSASCAVSVSGIAEVPAVEWSNTPSYQLSSVDGSVISGSNYVTLNTIGVNSGSEITVSNIGSTYTWLTIVQYDSNMAFVRKTEGGNSTNALTLTADTNTRFIRISVFPNNTSTNNAPADQIEITYSPFVAIPCTGIMLDKTELTFDGVGSQTLTATVTPSDTTDALVWSSNDSSIASVSGGVVKARGNGSTTITATCGEYSATCAVSVSGITSGSEDAVPDAYEQVAYLESSGGPYINTGVSGGTAAMYEIKLDPTESNLKGQYEQYFSGAKNEQIAPKLYHDAGKNAMCAGNKDTWNHLYYSEIGSGAHVIEYNGNNYVVVDGNVIETDEGNTLANKGWGTVDWHVFTSGGELSVVSSMRLYYLKMWTDGVLVRDFVPVKRVSDNVYGLYDLVGAEFYENVGTGAFTAPSD